MQSQLSEANSDRCKHKLLELSPIGLALCRTDGTFLEANPAFANIIGLTVAETLKLNYWEILEAERACTEKKYLESQVKLRSCTNVSNGLEARSTKSQLECGTGILPVLENGAISQVKHNYTDRCEAAYKHKDGKLVPVRVSEWAIETEGEHLIWLSAIEIFKAQDRNNAVSETGQDYCNSHLENLLAQRTAELAKTQEQLQQKIAELQQAQEKMRLQNQIIEQMHESVICTDMEGLITNWNQGAQKLYGYQENEVIGQPVAVIYPPEQHEFLLEQVIKPLQAKGEQEVEVITRRKSGEDFYSHLSLSVLKDSAGKVVGMIGYLTDISDRKALEKELTLRQARFDAFFTDSPAGLCILDDRLRFVQINKMLAQMNGLNPAEHIGKTVGEILPDLAPVVEPLYQQILSTKKPVLNIEISGENPRQPEVRRHVAASYFPLLNESGEAIGIGAVIIEVTDRKLAEEALRQSEQLYRSMASNFPNGAVMLFDRELRYTLAEGTELAAVGLSKELMEGKTIWEIFPAEFCTAVEPNYRAALTGETVVTEFTYNDRSYLAYTLPVRNERQEITGGMLMTQNISDRKLAEEALRESEEQYRRIVETAAEGIWSIDASSNTTFVNKKMCDMLGYKTEEILGKSLFAFMNAEGISIARANLKRQRLGMGEQYDFKFRRRDGSDLWAIVSASTLFDKQGSYAGSFAMIADITDRKLAEAALQQSEAKFRSLYELTSLPVLMLDENGIRDANTAATELFGCTDAQQLYGKHPAELSPPTQPNGEDSFSLGNQMIAIAFERGNHRFDWVHWRTDGTDFPVEVVLTIIEMDNQITIQAVVQDLTERKLAEAISVRSEQTLRQQAQREQLLNQLASQIRNSLELDTILETSVQEIWHLMQLDWCLFIWYRPDSNPPIWEVVCEAKNPALGSFIGSYPVHEQSSPLLLQILSLQILRVDDVSTLDDAEIREIYETFKIKSVLSLPIQTAGDMGAICCYQSGEMRNWSDSEVELMQAVAAQIAIAIDHAELYTQTRTAAELAQAQTQKLEQTLHQLQRTQSQLIQSEKMSSLGQLVAGVAHEINNPVNFIYGNLTYADEYSQKLLTLLQIYQQEYPQPTAGILAEIEAVEIDYLVEDLPKILASMKVGADRIRDIVLSLRNFSRLDEAEMKKVDIHEGIESTLMILQNRLKNKSDRPNINVIKHYGNLPEIECYPGQLNQVFMNLLSNAIDALEMQINNSDRTAENHLNTAKNLEIRIHTEVTDNNCVAIRIADSGPGISEDVKNRLFDPFFTTKPIGKGTGLGLAISQSIVVEKHGGQLSCNSELGQGAEFAIEIPLRQQK